MGEMIPIVRGAKYRDVSTGENHGENIRVESVWIDEDGSIQISIYDKYAVSRSEARRTVDKDSFIERLENEEIIRTNTDHEAWQYRNK